MNKFAKIGCAVAVALGMSSVAQAGKFEVWSDESGKAGQTIAVVSFAGDGVTQDAQLDMTYAENLQFVSASVKVPGSVCVVFQDQRLMRVVPPSGAGQALSAKSVDYCSFSFKSTGAPSKGAKFSTKFQECAAPSGASSCSTDALDLSEKSAK